MGKSELFDNMALNKNYPTNRKLIDLSSFKIYKKFNNLKQNLRYFKKK